MYLNVHSYYSLRYGIRTPKGLVEFAVANQLEQFVLTDVNSTSACIEFALIAKKHNIKPIVGVDFRNSVEQQFVALAKNNEGFREINEYLSLLYEKEEFFIESEAPTFEHVWVIYPNPIDRELKSYEFLGLKAEQLNQYKFSKKKLPQEKYVALATATFTNKASYNTHRLFRAIDNNTLLSKLTFEDFADPNDTFRSVQEVKDSFEEFPFLLTQTEELLAECSIDFPFGGVNSNQATYTTSKEEDWELLKKLTYEGVPYRFKNPTQEIYDRIEKELELIREKNFVSYFLINWDIVGYAQSKGYFYVGRGSGANSIVAYLLKITDVDPIELDLYFERFINLYRQNPPDFDIDFAWTDREDMTNYIFSRFKNVALVGVYNTFQYKAAIRELGKVFGLPKFEIDKLCSGNYNIRQVDDYGKLVLKYAGYIQNFPNYLGIHSSGIVISEKPIHSYTATFMPPKGFPTLHIDMVAAEDIGWHKFDILSQRGLSKIKDSLTIIQQNQPENADFDIHDIPRFKEDLTIKKILRQAQAIGCFYVESPAMRMLLKKLQVDTYLGLVAASSVIRPGVAQSGMMRQYIIRCRQPEHRNDAPKVLLDLMPDTYGVMVYQEDVIKVAHYFAGLTLGEADMLRRGMSGKYRSREEFDKIKAQFFSNCKNKGYDLALTSEIWRQIESFAGYAFAKGHSASYAVESYQALFLKAYFPLEYMVATVNNGGGFYSVETYINEARQNGALIEAPCVNRSFHETRIIDKTIFLGYHLLRSLESRTIKKMLSARQEGAFTSLQDFIRRTSISLEQVRILIRINAFRLFNTNKRELMWEAHLVLHKPAKQEQTQSLFVEDVETKIPELDNTEAEDAFDEMELLGFSLSPMFDLVKEQNLPTTLANDLPKRVNQQVSILGSMVTIKRTGTKDGKQMWFGTFLDREGVFIDTVHFPLIVKKFPWRGRGVYLIEGKVVSEFDALSIEVTNFQRVSIIEDPRYSDK